MKTMPVVTTIAKDVEIIRRLLAHDPHSAFAFDMLKQLEDYLKRIATIRDQEPQGERDPE